MREKFAAFALLLFIALPATGLRADEPSSNETTQTSASAHKRVALEVHSTLAFTVCVAKLLTNGLGTQEARQMCIDSSTN